MEHDTVAGGRIDARSHVLEELGFFDPVETMDDMFCNANLMKEIDFNAAAKSQYDDLFQGSVNGDSVDRAEENSQDFAVGEMFENICLLWSVDELLCDDDEEHGVCRDLDFLSQNEEIIEGESTEPDYLSIEKKLENISLVESVDDRELGFNEVILKESLTVEGSCASYGEKQTEVKVESFNEIEEGEIVEYSQDVVDGWSADYGDDDADNDGDDDGDNEDYLFQTINGPIRSKNEVKVLPSVLPVDIHLEEHHHTIPVGNVFSVIGPQIIVEGLENHRPLNEGSILWLTNTRSALGVVDEIFGPVKNPYYLVRYDSEEQVPSGVDRGDPVSYVPEFVHHILDENTLHQKGYDASGENDEEVSDGEFSDDAKEEEHRRTTRMTKRAAGAWLDNRNRRSGWPPRPRPSSLPRIGRSHFVRNRNRSSPSFPSSSGNNCYPIPVSQSSPPAQCQMSPAPLPSPFFFQARSQNPQKPEVTRLQRDHTRVMNPPLFHPSPNRLPPVTQAAHPQPQGMAPPFSPQQCQQQQQQQNWVAPSFTRPMVVPPPVNQIIQSPPAQSFFQVDHMQQPNLSFSPSPAPIYQPSCPNAQTANIWAPTVQNYQPTPVFGTVFPRANVDQNLIPNTVIHQPDLMNTRMANAPPSMPPAGPTMPAAQPAILVAQPCLHLPQPCIHSGQPSMNPCQPSISPAQPDMHMHMAQPNLHMTQQNMNFAQPNMNLAQPNTNFVQPNMNLAQPNMNLAQPNMNFAQPNMNLAQPNMNLAQPNMNLAQPNMNLAQPNMNFAQPNMSLPQSNMNMTPMSTHMAHPSMSPAQQCISPANPNMNMGQPNMHMGQPNMHMGQPNMHMGQPSIHPSVPIIQMYQPIMSPQHCIHPSHPNILPQAQPILPPDRPSLLPPHFSTHPAQPCMSPAHPSMLISQPNMHHLPPQPSMHPTQPCVHQAQPIMHQAQPIMHPAQPCLHMAEPSMHPAQPGVHHAQLGVHQVQPDVHQAQPGMHEAQPGMHQAQPGVHQVPSSMHMAEPSTHPAQPGMHKAQPGMHPSQLGVHQVQPCMHMAEPITHPAQPEMHKAQPGMHQVQPCMHMAEPSTHLAQPGMHQAQPGMHQAQPGMHPAQPSDIPAQPARPSMHLAQSSMYPAQPCMHNAQPGMNMAQPCIHMPQTPSFVLPNMQNAQSPQNQGMEFLPLQATGAPSPSLQNVRPTPPNGWTLPAHVPG